MTIHTQFATTVSTIKPMVRTNVPANIWAQPAINTVGIFTKNEDRTGGGGTITN